MIHQDVSFKITGMTCASCRGRVERVLQVTDGVSGAFVNLATEAVRLEVKHAAALPEAFAAFQAAGYPVIVRTAKFSVEEMTCASWTASCSAGLVRVGRRGKAPRIAESCTGCIGRKE